MRSFVYLICGASGSTIATISSSRHFVTSTERSRPPQPMSATRIFRPAAICRARLWPKAGPPMPNAAAPAASPRK